MSTVSIIMPNYNHGKELHVSLLAAATQSVAADEIIVVDDDSTDASVEIIEQFATHFPNVRLLRNAEHAGVAKAVSLGLEAARGDYVVMASADEKMLPTMIENLSAVSRRFPAAQMITSAYTQWWPERNEIRVHGPDSELGPWFLPSPDPSFIAPEQLHRFLRRSFVWLAVNSAMFSRASILEAGGYDPALRWHSDWFLSYAIAFKYGVVVVPKSLALFREVGESYSRKGMRDPQQQRDVAMAIQNKLLEDRFNYFRRAAMRSPVIMSTFMRQTILGLMSRPSMYPMLRAILRWWVLEVVRGRRPGAWARFLHGGSLPKPKAVGHWSASDLEWTERP